MSNISHYTETGEVHPDVLALPDNDKKDILTRELRSIDTAISGSHIDRNVIDELYNKKRSIKKILDNLG